ncbi:hypothetical protein BU14_0556s0006 [Porphyra umbilicalis]|uniref:MnmE helical domain-containing protein n=1 Tax=Porphyra umbilicalis TaxID=2786 RepID=A0A1X6NS14_PORUM|nr:hypothetical protein BU14_0556s0006 [Porphyra umbilicalis]|eukprot:OSX71320.1 hypothetical protein BU14_0556s0006 [Porphyra umbilicalis]
MVGHLADGRVGERVRGGWGWRCSGAQRRKSTLVNALARRPADCVGGGGHDAGCGGGAPRGGGVSVTVRDTAGVRRDGGEGVRGGGGASARASAARVRRPCGRRGGVCAGCGGGGGEGGDPDADAAWAALADVCGAPPGGGDTATADHAGDAAAVEGADAGRCDVDADADAEAAADAAYTALGGAPAPPVTLDTFRRGGRGGVRPPHVLLVANKADLLDGPAAAAAVVDAATRFAALSPAPAAAVAVSLTAGGGGRNGAPALPRGAPCGSLAGQPPAGGGGGGTSTRPPASTTNRVVGGRRGGVGGARAGDGPVAAVAACAKRRSLPRARHRRHVTAAVAALDAFLAGRSRRPTAASAAADDAVAAESVAADEADCAYGLPMDVAAEELRTASRAVAEITGAVPVEAVLDVVFREFCIGK